MKVKLVNYSQVIAQLFTMLTLGYSVKVKLVKRFTMLTLGYSVKVKLVNNFTKGTLGIRGNKIRGRNPPYIG